MKLGFIGKHLLHHLVIGLMEQAACAVKDGCNFRVPFGIIIEEAPIAVVPVKVSKQSVRNEHIPEVLTQNRWGDILLLVNSIHHVRKLSSASVAIRVKNCVLD